MRSLILFLCLVKLDNIIVEQKDCIIINIRLDDPNAMQIRILLQERRRISKRNRKQINAEDNVNDPRVLTMLAMINLNPYILTRELHCNLGILYVTVWRILQRHKFHPYYITLIQDVSENDMRLRRQFCRWALRMITEDPTFFSILFSDKASFHNNGQLNKYNCHYYNPHWTQHRPTKKKWFVLDWSYLSLVFWAAKHESNFHFASARQDFSFLHQKTVRFLVLLIQLIWIRL